MASILTNPSAMAALATMRAIDRDLATTQARISSGLKVESPADNAAYWSISTTMKTESSSLGVIGEALGMGAALADVATTASQSLIDLLGQIRERVVAAGESTNDKDKIQTELEQLYTQMTDTVKSASFNGQNWLAATNKAGGALGTATNVISGITSGQLQFINVTLVAADGKNTAQTVATVTALRVANLNSTAIGATLGVVDAAMKNLMELGSTFGAASARMGIQKDFISALTDAIDRGIGSLIDADMNEESTRLKALQTQQQLAVQSLSIANTSSENILRLFQN
ncbi:flagellin [Agrobacterium pusense]|uniref:flagellin N-terminal helical domain-containing protein n=1 Tax=Agrobacterium pusense TaxID=648995 RepID=UPI0024494BAD|nr:flagellin [Agrobacterium pusense]MDH0872976.1 flagellin [Agrobacterium pusense]